MIGAGRVLAAARSTALATSRLPPITNPSGGSGGWVISNLTNLQDPVDAAGDGTVENRGSVNGGSAYGTFGFDDPGAPLVGEQKFRLKAAKSNPSVSMMLVIKLLEGSTIIATLGSIELTTTATIYDLTWQGSQITDRSNVVIRIEFSDAVSGAYYTIWAIEWMAAYGGSASSGGDPPSWPPAWPARPSLGMFHGIGQPFGDWGSKTAVQLYNEWLGRSANIVACWCNSASDRGWKDFDGIAGGTGSADTTWSGQLNETNPNRALDPSYWPVTSPFVFPLGAVPYTHQNKQLSNGQWTRPGIWSEIARGDFDAYYSKLFRRLAYRCGQIGRDPRTVVIRWCWEANGNWYPHSIGPDKASWITAWRRVMDIMRSAVGSVLGTGKSFMIEFGPAGHLRFGNGASERLWNVYPGDDWVDICGLGIHDQVGITVQADWDQYLRHPATIAGTPFEGYIDWLDYGLSRGKWLGTSEIESNYITSADGYFPRTNSMSVMWTTGFEPLRRRYDGSFLYHAYLYNGETQSYLHAQPTWSDPYKQLYKPGGTGEVP